MEHDTIFIKNESESDTEEEGEYILQMKFQKRKKKRKKNFVIKELMSCNESITDKSLDTIRFDNLSEWKEDSTIESLEVI
eukprot:15356119-Ditylum_brightwellii.AAC.1